MDRLGILWSDLQTLWSVSTCKFARIRQFNQTPFSAFFWSCQHIIRTLQELQLLFSNISNVLANCVHQKLFLLKPQLSHYFSFVACLTPPQLFCYKTHSQCTFWTGLLGMIDLSFRRSSRAKGLWNWGKWETKAKYLEIRAIQTCFRLVGAAFPGTQFTSCKCSFSCLEHFPCSLQFLFTWKVSSKERIPVLDPASSKYSPFSDLFLSKRWIWQPSRLSQIW